MLHKISVFTVISVFVCLFFLTSCDMMDRDAENPVGIDVQDTAKIDQEKDDYFPEERDSEGLYPLPLLPDPPGAEGADEVELTIEEFEKIKSQIPDDPYSDPSVKEEEGPQKVYASWHYINSRIYIRAYSDNGRYVGLNCKEWARRVVRDATGKNIPSTADGGYGWYWNWSPHVAAWRGPVDMALPGQILQMWWGCRRCPHTAIVMGRSSSGMYWIDSNWYWDRRVRIHWVSYGYFYRKVGWWFSINQILP